MCAVGVADSGIIADHQLSASSTNSNNYTPQHGRLRLTSGKGAWTVSKGNRRGLLPEDLNTYDGCTKFDHFFRFIKIRSRN